MNVLQATIDHVNLLTPLFDEYRQFYQQSSDLPAAASFLTERLSKDDSVIFLAIDGDSALGFVQLYPSFSSVSMKRLWILNDLYVDGSARRRGIAEHLLRRAAELARETKSKGLVLETGVKNVAAQKLYQKTGWSKEQQFDRYYLNII